MKVSVEQVYTSAACNRIPEIIDWNAQGLICFGASNAVVIYDTNLKGRNPLTVLHHHRSKVNSVKWLRKPDGSCTEFLSCSADKTAAIWSLVEGKWTVTSSLKGHTEGITCIHGIYTTGDDAVVFTGSIDSMIRVWERKNGTTTDKQIINLNTGLCLTLYAHMMPVVNQPVLFCALDDHKIHIFAGEEFHRVHTLAGHEDWVRGLDALDVDDSTILLASSSQDTYIRLWRIHLFEDQECGPGIKVEQKVFPAHQKLWAVKLDAVLAGHEGWVYGVQWHPCGYDKVWLVEVLLGSCTQDTYIRLWRIHLFEDQECGPGIKVEQKVFPAHQKLWAVKLDAVLAGHEGWVYGVQWHPCGYDKDTNKNLPVYRLLSSSLDKTLIIWEPDAPSQGEGEGGASGAWVEKVRVGEVGGNGLGFYGSRFGPNGESFLGHGYNGSFHIWKLNKETRQWEPSVVCGGHFNAVEDVRWEPEGRYIMSVSADQTTRVHAPWRRADDVRWEPEGRYIMSVKTRPPGSTRLGDELMADVRWEPEGRYIMSVSADQTTRVHAPWRRADGAGTEWHEIARPQVHGYDMASLALVNATTFASAAEEKVIRVFRAPANFTHNFENITGSSLGVVDTAGPEGASVPSLGLSNKAVFSGDDSKPDLTDDTDGYFVPVQLSEPPTEETLMQNTLWPEVQKLYGHGYEVFSLDASPDGTLVASACKATVQEHAAVLLWETTTWQQIQKLTSHTLTVTQLAFSPNSQQLLSVSRDRKWFLYKRREGSNLFDIEAYTDKTNGVHSRIIWCCAWTHDGTMFGTGSRDGKVCLWTSSETPPPESSLGSYALYSKPLDLANTSVTALAFAPLKLDQARVVATGFESGVISLYKFNLDGWSLLHELDNSAGHHLTVRRLTFTRNAGEKDNEVMLASCGSDTFVRIYRIAITL
ncbi:elongator complex protein 2 [Phthorimaea operculella]|nr:elongator complex protein 2 [Phthorimaea operculella]